MTETNHSNEFNKLMTTVSKWEDKNYDNLKITVADKYRIMALFIPHEHHNILMNARKNHSNLNKKNMNYLLGEALVKLFLSICKINTNPLKEHEIRSIVSVGAFRRIIQGTLEEMDQLYREIDNLKSKNMFGYITEEDHMKKIDECILMGQKLLEENKKLKMKLDEQEKYYKEKLKARSKRYNDTEQYYNKQFDKLSDEQQTDLPEQEKQVVYY